MNPDLFALGFLVAVLITGFVVGLILARHLPRFGEHLIPEPREDVQDWRERHWLDES